MPFIILDATDDSFMQAAIYAETAYCYRVEYREGDRMHYAEVPLEQAARLMEAFVPAPCPTRKPSLGSRYGYGAAVPSRGDDHAIAVLLAVVALAVWFGVSMMRRPMGRIETSPLAMEYTWASYYGKRPTGGGGAPITASQPLAADGSTPGAETGRISVSCSENDVPPAAGWRGRTWVAEDFGNRPVIPCSFV